METQNTRAEIYSIQEFYLSAGKWKESEMGIFFLSNNTFAGMRILRQGFHRFNLRVSVDLFPIVRYK